MATPVARKAAWQEQERSLPVNAPPSQSQGHTISLDSVAKELSPETVKRDTEQSEDEPLFGGRSEQF